MRGAHRDRPSTTATLVGLVSLRCFQPAPITWGLSVEPQSIRPSGRMGRPGRPGPVLGAIAWSLSFSHMVRERMKRPLPRRADRAPERCRAGEISAGGAAHRPCECFLEVISNRSDHDPFGQRGGVFTLKTPFKSHTSAQLAQGANRSAGKAGSNRISASASLRRRRMVGFSVRLLQRGPSFSVPDGALSASLIH